jgi:GNAT superfamily N-acetyltransferase
MHSQSPAAYPERLVETWTAQDGAALTIRPIKTSDDAIETAFIESLSFQTGYQRLLSPRTPQKDEIERFTHIDYVDEMALVAIESSTSGERMCGVARYVRDESDAARAAFAIVLADDWQGRGLGGKLMRSLIAEARRAGISELSDITLSTNAGMLALARRLGFAIDREPGDASVRRIRLLL